MNANFELAVRTARDGLDQLEAALPGLSEELDRALELIVGLKGRLIVTGLGKSGHIAAKLAATFASTGTPAYFVHPSEASHGDLGMIRNEDAVLMLSWSGGTRELFDIADYTRRFNIPLVIITSNPEGKLTRAADIRLVLPKAREACPHNLAPTTSTLMQMALGDALAISALREKGFTETSFHQFHPGGRLGASLTSLGQIAVSGDGIPLVEEHTPIIGLIGELTAKSLGIVGVRGADGRLFGVVTDGDVRRFLGRNSDMSIGEAMNTTTAADLMTRDFVWFGPDTLAAEALHVMQTRKISGAFVLADGKPVGCITMLQLLGLGVA